MDLKGILSIAGEKGLFKTVKQAQSSIIVESFETKRRKPAYATTKISSLEDIAIFTEDEDLPLIEVFKNIYRKAEGGEAISHKASNPEILSYFEEILPNYDKDRVYASDMKRVFNWYNALHRYGLVTFTQDELDGKTPEVAAEEETATDATEEVAAE